MAKAKKLPSGNWRCLVYDRSESVLDASGVPVLDKDGKPKQKRVYESFTADTRKEAEYQAAEFALKKNNSKGANITFGNALDEYIQKRASILSPRTIMDYKRIRKNELQSLMPIMIKRITQEMIQEAINEEAMRHSPKTVRNSHGLISAVLRQYRPDFALNTSLPKKIRPDIYVPTDVEISALINHVAGTELELPVLLAAFGPMRRGEICALVANSISGNIVHVHQNMVLNTEREWIIKQPKSYAGDRYIEFPDFVADKFKDVSGRITLLTPNNITDRFATVLKQAGLPHFRFHDLRHYSASIQHAIGIPDSYIMARGGWGNDGTLKSVYRHTMEDKMKEMNEIANRHFTVLMQHGMQHKKTNP